MRRSANNGTFGIQSTLVGSCGAGRVPPCQLEDKFCEVSSDLLAAELGASAAGFAVAFGRILVVLSTLEIAMSLRESNCEESAFVPPPKFFCW
mmetsp:Transcript_98836/g.285265  ORF Transcript_98836/g.285265 Transcript_98836/m.285265 type:complete len:93 (-) Transcript_98836:482-760(-)